MTCSKDISSLYSLLTDCQNLKQNFELLSVNFNNNILEKRNCFQIGTAIVLFLRSKDVLNTQQQYLIAYFLLWDLGRNENDPNPFVELIYSAINSNDVKFGSGDCPVLDPIGRTFLGSILTQPQNLKDLLKKTPLQVYQEGLIVKDIDLSEMEKSINDNKNDLFHILKCGVSCIIPFKDITVIRSDPLKPEKQGQNNDENIGANNRTVMESLLLTDNPPVRRSLRPEFIRLQPPLHCSGTMDELIWLDPSPVADHLFVWDINNGNGGSGVFGGAGGGSGAGNGNQDNSDDTMMTLLKSAKTTSLLPLQVSQLQAKLKENPDLLKKIDFKPPELSGLVEKNPNIAIDALLILFDSKEVASYFAELIKMEISLHSLEVVNQLTTAVELPAQFIHHYIEKCFQSCHNSADKYYCHRLVRLVCVFLQSLIRNKIIDIKEIQSVILQFCLDFNNIKEANSLYKLIKSANGGAEGD